MEEGIPGFIVFFILLYLFGSGWGDKDQDKVQDEEGGMPVLRPKHLTHFNHTTPIQPFSQ